MRLRLLLAATAVALVATAVPASPAGVGGVEVTPPNGTSFAVEIREGERALQPFVLQNIASGPSTVRLYAAAAERSASGEGWSIGAAGSASWIDLEEQEVTLGGGESRRMTFAVDGGPSDRTGAIVVEQGAGTVVQRAGTLVYAEVASPLPLPLLLVVLAVVLVLLAGAGVATLARRRRGVGA